jgi:hypothetical protein
MVLIGWLFAMWSIGDQLTRGRGTPLPVMATQTLLIAGPFAYCRQPDEFRDDSPLFWPSNLGGFLGRDRFGDGLRGCAYYVP